ncbi:hypothetical protein AVEN_111608-1 [Araneus ventricosus]|uniref:Uncharacterized protein n=1 Tax=Araneus ventricosus TaxID=182803 RepID=A0A4Y2C1Y7_ARAVE|nr:hypothetical protein AVEN_111608-1 [Araneus ventricosus]
MRGPRISKHGLASLVGTIMVRACPLPVIACASYATGRDVDGDGYKDSGLRTRAIAATEFRRIGRLRAITQLGLKAGGGQRHLEKGVVLDCHILNQKKRNAMHALYYLSRQLLEPHASKLISI